MTGSRGSSGPGPLAGVRVVELVGLGPGPFAGMMLADLGADVVRIERPGGLRIGQPEHDVLARGQRSLALDLSGDDGRQTLLDLVQRADILIDPFRPGVTERLGVGPDVCLERNPALVVGRMTGWGQDGPLAPRAGHDITYLATSGALGLIGPADGPPTPPVNMLADFGGGAMLLLVGVLAALHHAQATGAGQVVDAAMVDGSAALTAMVHQFTAAGLWGERGTNLLDGGAPYYGVYACADGGWLAIGALEPPFFQALLDGLGLAEDDVVTSAYADPARWPAARERIAAVVATGSRDQWEQVFAGTDACVAPVLSLDEAHEHPHLRARQTYVEVDGVPQPAPAPRFSVTPTSAPGAPPQPGSTDAATVLRQWDTESRP